MEDLIKLHSLNVISPFLENNVWYFLDNNGKRNTLVPAEFTSTNFSPYVISLDKLLSLALKQKNVYNVEASEELPIKKKNIDNFEILFSEEPFPTADIELIHENNFFDGELYQLVGYNTSVPENQKVWICPVIKNYFSNTPKKIFVEMRISNVQRQKKG